MTAEPRATGHGCRRGGAGGGGAGGLPRAPPTPPPPGRGRPHRPPPRGRAPGRPLPACRRPTPDRAPVRLHAPARRPARPETGDGPLASIDVADLARSFPTATGTPLIALDGVAFRVPERQVVAIVGPNGCGKSTLLRLVGGLRPPPP